MLNDQYRYEEALSLAKEILEYEDELASLRQLLVESDEEIVSVRGVPLSQCVKYTRICATHKQKPISKKR